MSSAKPAPDVPQSKSQKNSGISKDDPRRRARTAEAIGLAIIALLILVYALVRYGRSIPWNAR